MNRWKVSVLSLLILNLVLLPGILDLNSAYAVTKQPTTITTSILTAMPIKAGKSVKDSASLFGANVASATGDTVTYRLFSGSSCSGTSLQSKSVKVTAGPAVPTSPPFTINIVGSYSLKASFLGDALNGASSSKCETPVTVMKASPTVSTSLSATTITAAGSVTDLATLTGATATAHGTMTYQVFAGGTCSGSQVSVSTTSVIKDIAQPSKAFSNSPGTYSFTATYSGDQNNAAASTSSCPASEILTITKTTPTISTTLLQTTIVAGQSVTDSATLVGATSSAGGTVTYTLYRDITCTTSIDTSTVTVTNGHVPNSKAFVINDATHTYGILASYSGDSSNNAATMLPASCEQPINVNKASPTLSTQLSATSISFGGTISDSATLTGAAATAGGSVTYSLYSNGACTGPVVPGQTDTETVTNGIVPSTSTPLTPNSAGTFGIQAVYTGDASNNGATSSCEKFTVSPVAISTTPSATTVSTAQTISDQATLTGVSSNAGGTVTYQINAKADCTGALQLGIVTVTVTNGVVPSSGPFQLDTLSPGPYGFTAIYSGDKNNAGVTGSCEPFTLVIATPTLATQLSATTITVSNTVTDSATLTGGTANAGGSVTYSEYNGGSCSGGPIGSDTETVTNGIVPTTSTFGFGSPGFYSFRAVYTGDGVNKGATSPCEPLTVNADSPTISTLLSATNIVHGGSVTDSSALFGATATAGGTVTITMYSGGSCSGTVVGSSGPLTVTNGIVPTSGSFTAATAGTYSFLAVYSGDTNNNPATASCEILTAT